jgi:hypothetical protein
VKEQLTEGSILGELSPLTMSDQEWPARWHIQLKEGVDLPQSHMMWDRTLIAEMVVVAMVGLVARASQFE